MEGISQANAVLTSYNSAVMSKLAQLMLTMNAMQEKMKTLAATSTNLIKTKREFYCCRYRSNSFLVVQPSRPSKLTIKRWPTTKNDIGEVKSAVNDS